MDKNESLAALAALAHDTRLEVFRLLARSGPGGVSAGAIATSLGGRQNTISTNLAILARAGLIDARRDGRSVWYSVDVEGMRGLLGFLLHDCCGGPPEACTSLLNNATRFNHAKATPQHDHRKSS